VGYRTYPDGTADDQRSDCDRALRRLAADYPGWCRREEDGGGLVLVGHSSGAGERERERERERADVCGAIVPRTCWSSPLLASPPARLAWRTTGAHVALLMLVEWIERDSGRMGRIDDDEDDPLQWVDGFVGMSGPYDISHHFDYEAARHVEELSPMKPACGLSREGFRRHSPALRLRSLLATNSDGDRKEPTDSIRKFPKVLLLHGIEDGTVPFTATADAARLLRQCGVGRCDELYVAGTGHQDAVVQLMAGGPTREHVVEWIAGLDEGGGGESSSPQCSGNSSDRRMVAASKL
jgi:hypothetical protein